MYCKINSMFIKLIFMKIRLNDSFERLGVLFNISESYAGRIFRHNVPIIAQFLNKFIYWPAKDEMKQQLPIPFIYRFNNVVSMVDCFEIEIEKPTDPVKQALTWSEYKKRNTLKYLVSSTCDGLINLVSEGMAEEQPTLK